MNKTTWENAIRLQLTNLQINTRRKVRINWNQLFFLMKNNYSTNAFAFVMFLC